MSKPEAAGEPSMEEILASIRKIIAEEPPYPRAQIIAEAATRPGAAAASGDGLDDGDLPAMLKAKAQPAKPAPLLGRIAESLRGGGGSGGAAPSARPGPPLASPVADKDIASLISNDLGDLLDDGPAPPVEPADDRAFAAAVAASAAEKVSVSLPASGVPQAGQPQLGMPQLGMPSAPQVMAQPQTGGAAARHDGGAARFGDLRPLDEFLADSADAPVPSERGRAPSPASSSQGWPQAAPQMPPVGRGPSARGDDRDAVPSLAPPTAPARLDNHGLPPLGEFVPTRGDAPPFGAPRGDAGRSPLPPLNAELGGFASLIPGQQRPAGASPRGIAMTPPPTEPLPPPAASDALGGNDDERTGPDQASSAADRRQPLSGGGSNPPAPAAPVVIASVEPSPAPVPRPGPVVLAAMEPQRPAESRFPASMTSPIAARAEAQIRTEPATALPAVAASEADSTADQLPRRRASDGPSPAKPAPVVLAAMGPSAPAPVVSDVAVVAREGASAEGVSAQVAGPAEAVPPQPAEPAPSASKPAAPPAAPALSAPPPAPSKASTMLPPLGAPPAADAVAEPAVDAETKAAVASALGALAAGLAASSNKGETAAGPTTDGSPSAEPTTTADPAGAPEPVAAADATLAESAGQADETAPASLLEAIADEPTSLRDGAAASQSIAVEPAEAAAPEAPSIVPTVAEAGDPRPSLEALAAKDAPAVASSLSGPTLDALAMLSGALAAANPAPSVGSAPRGALVPASGSTECEERSLDDTVAELLRPMLRQWLSDNMPRIVEKALRIELAQSLRPGAGEPTAD